jgi:hypothetical protein
MFTAHENHQSQAFLFLSFIEPNFYAFIAKISDNTSTVLGVVSISIVN